MHHPGWLESSVWHPAGFLVQLLEALTPLSGGSQQPFSSSSVEHEPRGVVVLLTGMEQNIGEVRLGRGSSTSVTMSTFHGTRKHGCIPLFFPRHIPTAPPAISSSTHPLPAG